MNKQSTLLIVVGNVLTAVAFFMVVFAMRWQSSIYDQRIEALTVIAEKAVKTDSDLWAQIKVNTALIDEMQNDRK